MIPHLASLLKKITSQKNALFLRPQFGIEKEALRVDSRGNIAQTQHPLGLGSALTHPFITTDYSEALLEFITPVFTSTEELLAQLHDYHKFCITELTEEFLWPASMPCRLGSQNEIPVAYYGSSNSGKMKSIYRVGLGHRYGRHMQTVAGIHYNFSMSDEFWQSLAKLENWRGELQHFKTKRYLGLIRNFYRFGWLIPYLCGASPVFDKSFLGGREHSLQELNSNDLYAPWATSLRLSDLGYQSEVQKRIYVSFNSLDEYISSLCNALNTRHPDYVDIGVKKEREYRQLNTYILQIENEYYSPIRPKAPTAVSKPALAALREGGIQYIELRCMDINPFVANGIDATTIHFLNAFLLMCLLQESDFFSPMDWRLAQQRLKIVVNQGRSPELELPKTENTTRRLTDWGKELIEQTTQVAHLLDLYEDEPVHVTALQTMQQRLDNPNSLPSALVLQTLKEQNQSWVEYALKQAQNLTATLSHDPLPKEKLLMFQQTASQSLQQQIELEQRDTVSIDDYIDQYHQQSIADGCSDELLQPLEEVASS